MLKKIIKFGIKGVLTFMVLLSAGCTQNAGEQNEGVRQQDRLDRILESNEIIVATEGTWSPWTYHDADNKLMGFDVEVAQKVADKLGVKVTFVEAKWDGIFAGIDAGRYDMAANGVEMTEERAQKYDFSAPYAFIKTAIIVQADNDEITSFETLQGKRTANTLASTYATLAESYGAEAIGVDDLNQTIELLLAGRVDATLNAEVSYYDYMKVHPEAELKVAALTEDASHVSFPIQRSADNVRLIEAINTAIRELQESGEIADLSIKYFGTDISKQ